MEGQADDFYDQFNDQGVQLLIVMQETAQFNQAPTATDCEALQASQKAHVLYVPDHVLTDTTNMQVNMGAALLDNTGTWLSSPEGEDSFSNAYQEVYNQVGFGGF